MIGAAASKIRARIVMAKRRIREVMRTNPAVNQLCHPQNLLLIFSWNVARTPSALEGVRISLKRLSFVILSRCMAIILPQTDTFISY